MEENNNTPEQPKRRGRPPRRNKDVKTTAHVDGSALWTKLENPDPGKKYVWAYEGSSETGAEHYYGMGWDMEYCPEDQSRGPRPGGRRMAKAGEPYRSHGHVLMSIAKEEWDDIQARGDDGHSGRMRTEMYEQRLRGSKMDGDDERLLARAGMYSKPYFGED